MTQTGFGRTPLALIVEGSEGTVRALERLLVANGYAALKAYSARQATRLLERIRPDLVLVGADLPDTQGAEFIATIRRDAGLRASTPVLLVTSQELTLEGRAQVYASGSWGIVSLPLNEVEVVPQLESLVRAKQDADSAREGSLVDPDTGLYNVRGILRRVAEATADSERNGRPVTCVALGLNNLQESSGSDRQSLSEEFAAQLASAIRGADTAGRIGDSDFIVLAPDTNPEGASLLAERLLKSVEPVARAGVEVRAGHCTFESNQEVGGFIPVDLLTRATLALRKAQELPEGEKVRPYEA
jgi:PleD family two-component response regulator